MLIPKQIEFTYDAANISADKKGRSQSLFAVLVMRSKIAFPILSIRIECVRKTVSIGSSIHM